jgi:hypothetical protein
MGREEWQRLEGQDNVGAKMPGIEMRGYSQGISDR